MEKNEHFIQVCNYFFTGKQQVPAGEQPRLIFVFKRRLPVWKSMN